jgi:hypothetical protein
MTTKRYVNTLIGLGGGTSPRANRLCCSHSLLFIAPPFYIARSRSQAFGTNSLQHPISSPISRPSATAFSRSPAIINATSSPCSQCPWRLHRSQLLALRSTPADAGTSNSNSNNFSRPLVPCPFRPFPFLISSPLDSLKHSDSTIEPHNRAISRLQALLARLSPRVSKGI